MGNLRVSDFFPDCGSHQHVKCRILVKTGVFCFCGGNVVEKKEDESAQFASYFCSIFFGGGKGVTKISRTLVHGGICRRRESLFL